MRSLFLLLVLTACSDALPPPSTGNDSAPAAAVTPNTQGSNQQTVKNENASPAPMPAPHPEPMAPASAAPSPQNSASPASPAGPMASPSPGTTVKAEKSEGCSKTLDLPEGENSVMIEGKEWKYTVRKPSKYARTNAWPLVLALHPNGGAMSYWDSTTGDRNIRKSFGEKAIIIIPQALSKDWRDALETEEAFIDAILVKAKGTLCIDTSRIFSMGFSGGGSYSGYLGCYRKDIRAIASGGAVAYFKPDVRNCVGKPAAWITVGDQEAEKARLDFVTFWKTYNACKEDRKVLTPATCSAYSCPSTDAAVNFCSHPAGHVWPSFGTETAWSFFSKF